MKYRLTLLDSAADRSQEIELPFAPYPGLRLEPDWAGEFLTVIEVYWLHIDKRFEVYLE